MICLVIDTSRAVSGCSELTSVSLPSAWRACYSKFPSVHCDVNLGDNRESVWLVIVRGYFGHLCASIVFSLVSCAYLLTWIADIFSLLSVCISWVVSAWMADTLYGAVLCLHASLQTVHDACSAWRIVPSLAVPESMWATISYSCPKVIFCYCSHSVKNLE